MVTILFLIEVASAIMPSPTGSLLASWKTVDEANNAGFNLNCNGIVSKFIGTVGIGWV